MFEALDMQTGVFTDYLNGYYVISGLLFLS